MKSASKLRILGLLKRLGFFRIARMITGRRIRILCYHGVWLAEDGFAGDGMFMRPATFRARLECIRRGGFPVIALDEAVSALANGTRLPACPVVITIDDGWYSVLAEMAPALSSFGFPSTLYVATRHVLAGEPVPQIMARYVRLVVPASDELPPEADEAFGRATDLSIPIEQRLTAAREFVASAAPDPESYEARRVFHYLTPAEVAEVARRGMDIQLHTHNHSMQSFDSAGVRSEIELNRGALAGMLGRDESAFRHFCYPSGRWREDVAEALEAADVDSATTTVRGLARATDDRYFLPRLLDAEEISPLEFEAELNGVLEVARSVRRYIGRLFG